jgi:hypothetical protein
MKWRSSNELPCSVDDIGKAYNIIMIMEDKKSSTGYKIRTDIWSVSDANMVWDADTRKYIYPNPEPRGHFSRTAVDSCLGFMFESDMITDFK